VKAQYEVFEVLRGSIPRWTGVCCQPSPRLLELGQAASGVKYFLRDFPSGCVVAVNPGFGRQGSKIRETRAVRVEGWHPRPVGQGRVTNCGAGLTKITQLVAGRAGLRERRLPTTNPPCRREPQNLQGVPRRQMLTIILVSGTRQA